MKAMTKKVAITSCVAYLVVTLSVLMICNGCNIKTREERERDRYYPCMAITESGKEISMGLVFQTDPNDSVITVTLKRLGKEYYFDLRK